MNTKKRVTIKQIAQELGVSMMTVSRALNNSPKVDEETHERVKKTAHLLGYFPNGIAKSLVMQRTQTIGVVVPEITHSFFPDAIKGIEEAAYQAGYQIMLTHSAESSEREIAAIQTLVSKRVDGILASVAESDTDYDIYRQVMEWGLSVVFFDRCVFGIGASCVGIDDEESAMMVTRHLIERGYRKIAHLRGPLSISISKSRLQGYKKTLKKAGISYKEEWVVESGFHESGGYRAMMQLLRLPKANRPQAIIAVNDPAAFGAMKALNEYGIKIPKDMVIAGFSDDIRAALMPSPLTTIRQPAYEVGKRACQKLIRHIEDKDEQPEEIILKTELVIRSSSGGKK